MAGKKVWSRPLGQGQISALCLLAIAVHSLPLILADYAYVDDVWRAQLAERQMSLIESWGGQGRILVDWFYAVLSFGMATLNVFPLPLIIALPITAWAMQAWLRHTFAEPDVTMVLVVLPLWFQPFFLQNLSYQYEGPAMALAVVACVFAIVLRFRGWRSTVVGILLVGLAASIYQVSINVFAGLCCAEVASQVLTGMRLRSIWRNILLRVGQLVGGCVLYLVTAHQLIRMPERTSLLRLDDHLLPELWLRILLTFEKVSLLVTPGSAAALLGLVVLAALGLILGGYRVFRREEALKSRIGLLGILLLAVVSVIALVPGMALVFADFNDTARMFLGLGPAMVMFFLLAHYLLSSWDKRLCWLLALPLLFMLTFSYAYGRVLSAQKELDRTITSSLSQAISLNSELRDVRMFHLIGGWTENSWLPAAHGAFKVMPALRYVLNVRYLVLPEMMPRVGKANFTGRSSLQREQVLAISPVALVESEFFSVHRIGEDGYVLVKAPTVPEDAYQ